jgi:molybdenum cofactor cytidylyltransferase
MMAGIDGVPLGLHIGRTLASMDFGWRFAVCSACSPIAEHYAALGFTVMVNAAPESGQSHSLHLAVAAAAEARASALLVTLADMPFVTAQHIARIAATDGLAASHDGECPMPPALFPRALWSQLLATAGDAGARGLLRTAKAVTASPEELRDIDLPADLPRPHPV